MNTSLDIQLIVNQHQHRSGTPIEGRVLVTVHEPLDCKQLVIALQNTSRLLDDDGEVVLEQDLKEIYLSIMLELKPADHFVLHQVI